MLLAVLARYKVPAPLQCSWQIGAIDPAARVIVRILIPDSVAERPRALVMGVSKLSRYVAEWLVLDVGLRCPERPRGRIGLRGERQMDYCLGEVERGLGQADAIERGRRRGSDDECHRICHSDVLTREDHESPGKKPRVLAGGNETS